MVPINTQFNSFLVIRTVAAAAAKSTNTTALGKRASERPGSCAHKIVAPLQAM